MNELVQHFENSGYSRRQLDELKQKAMEKTTTAAAMTNINENNQNNESLVFPLYYFEGIKEFKSLIHDLKDDFRQLIGDTRVMFALKKGVSISNSMVRNKALCVETVAPFDNQKCNGPGCLQCPLTNTQHKLIINNTSISIPRSLNCKSRNVIYLRKCKLRHSSDCYFRRTTPKCHI